MSSIDSRGPGAFKLPINIAIDADGLIYVTDSGRDEVVILDRNENFVATIGRTNVLKPRDVAVTADRLYIGDIDGHCVHAFDRATRKLLFDIPRSDEATNLVKKLFQPANVAVDNKGMVYASDVGADRVQVYDTDGRYARTVGKYGDNVGEFSRPKGIAVDRENRLYAVDAATQVAQLFDETGRLLMWFGDPRSSNVGLQLPAKVSVDYDNVGLFQRYVAPDFQVEYLVVITSQFGPRKVSVFGFGHKK
jgi:DNA-binding beta-propeller fold protein YncE